MGEALAFYRLFGRVSQYPSFLGDDIRYQECQVGSDPLEGGLPTYCEDMRISGFSWTWSCQVGASSSVRGKKETENEIRC